MTTKHLPALIRITRFIANSDDFTLPELNGESEWHELIAQVELYGLSGLFWTHLQKAKISVPGSVEHSLKALLLRHRAASRARYSVVAELLQEFKANSLPVVALKGLALAPMLYPSEALRPMRDMDILVPKGRELEAADLLRKMGFELPDAHQNRFMRYSNQLPNATKTVDGFKISIEIHHDCLARDVKGHLAYTDVESKLQTVEWGELQFHALGHEHMLHHLCRHLEDAQPGGVLKMINVLDIILYAEKFCSEIDWNIIREQYPHSCNTLKCLHLIAPLSNSVQLEIGGVSNSGILGVGETMRSMRHIKSVQVSWAKKLKMLFLPPDWWLHLFYNVDPKSSLLTTKLLTHPGHLLVLLAKRIRSYLLGR